MLYQQISLKVVPTLKYFTDLKKTFFSMLTFLQPLHKIKKASRFRFSKKLSIFFTRLLFRTQYFTFTNADLCTLNKIRRHSKSISTEKSTETVHIKLSCQFVSICKVSMLYQAQVAFLLVVFKTLKAHF